MRSFSPRRSRPLVAVVALLLVAATTSCTGGDPDASGSPPADGSPSVGSSPRAVAAPEPVDADACTQTVGSLDLVIDPEPRVPDELTEAIRTTAGRAQRALAHVPLPGCSERVTVVGIRAGDGAANTSAQFQQISARKGLITIWTHDWFDLSTMGRSFVLVHEWWHQIQQLSMRCGPQDGCRSGDLDDVPVWLQEADANLQALRVTEQLGLASYEGYIEAHRTWTPRALKVLRAGTNPLELPPEETVNWYLMAQYAGYRLVDGKPLTFLRFWRLAGKTGDWHRAFELAFDVDYDAYVAGAFMGPDHLWN